MKTTQTITSTILLLCLTTVAFTAIPDGECCAACIEPLTKDLRPRKGEGKLQTVETYTTPVDTFTVPAADASVEDKAKAICGNYWKDNGGKTCCKQEDLAKRAEARKKRISKRLHKMLHVGIKKGHGKYKKHVSVFLEVIKDATVQQNIIDKSAADNNPITAEEIAEGIKMLEEVGAKKPEESDGEEERAKAKEKFKKCAETYGNGVVASLCFDCSTKVGSFYDENTKTTAISKEYCEAVTLDCAGLFGINARNMAIERFMRIAYNYMDAEAPKKWKIPKGIKKEADFKMLGECASDAAACSKDETKRQFFCGLISLRADNPALFGDGEETDITAEKLKGRKGGKKRLLLSKMARVTQRLLQSNENEGFITESANGVALEKIVSGAEYQQSELPEDTDGQEPASAKIMGCLAILMLMIGAQFF